MSAHLSLVPPSEGQKQIQEQIQKLEAELALLKKQSSEKQESEEKAFYLKEKKALEEADARFELLEEEHYKKTQALRERVERLALRYMPSAPVKPAEAVTETLEKVSEESVLQAMKAINAPCRVGEIAKHLGVPTTRMPSMQNLRLKGLIQFIDGHAKGSRYIPT